MGKQRIDWEAIHRRLALTTAIVSGDKGLDPAETNRILGDRAKAAAKRPAKTDVAERIEILSFSIAGEIYAVETRYVQEVCQLKDMTALPCTPPFLAGAMNLRGRILAIVDLRIFFELAARGLTELNRIIVLKEGNEELGLLADSIDGIGSVTTADLRARLPALTGIREKFLKGVTGRMLAVLDGGRLLADASLKVNEPMAR